MEVASRSSENASDSEMSVNLFITTFNVNGKAPNGLHHWFNFDGSNMPDLVVIGLQEMDVAWGNYIRESSVRQAEWLLAIGRLIPCSYKQVTYVRLLGIFMVIYHRENPNLLISQVKSSIVPTGFLGLGNKGGIGISLRLNESRICLINCHLAAGTNELLRRNQGFQAISQMRFANDYGIFEHEAVFWLGDLNYRLRIPMNFEQVVRECKSNRFQSLFHFDELREQQRLQVAFCGFHERVPEFRPTYKYDVGSSKWDSSEKKRVPAWCDRVLFWSPNECIQIEQTSYTSSEKVTISDHKPVCASFRLLVRGKAKKQKRLHKSSICFEELLKEDDWSISEKLANRPGTSGQANWLIDL